MGLQGLLAVFLGRGGGYKHAFLAMALAASSVLYKQDAYMTSLHRVFGHPHDGGSGTELPPRECTLQHTDDKSVGAYRTCSDHNASNPRRGVQQCEGWCWQRQLAPPSPCWTAIRHVLVLLQLTDACLARDAARAYPAGQRRPPLYN